MSGPVSSMGWPIKCKLFYLVKGEQFFLGFGLVDRKSDLRLFECFLQLSEFFLDIFRKSEFGSHLKFEFSYRLEFQEWYWWFSLVVGWFIELSWCSSSEFWRNF